METGTREKLMELLKTFRNGMLVTRVTRADEQSLRSRPMALIKVDDRTGDVWFMTSIESGKVDEIQTHADVCVTLQHDHKFLSLSGRASIVRSREKIEELWTEEAKVYFPKGKNDPEIALIRVHPSEGEYWDNGGVNRIKFLFEVVKAHVTGATPHFDQGQHGSVSLDGSRP
jgi:general stress protein 26